MVFADARTWVGPPPKQDDGHHPRRTKTKAIKQLEALGYKVTLEPLT